jgi:hypothetical protein
MSADGKPSNPKDAIASTRAPLHLLPLPALLAWSLAHLEGGSKYGFWNFAVVGVRATVYFAAAARHLFKCFWGQWEDPKTKVPHLGYVMACCAIIMEARHRGILQDDRPPALPNMDELFDQAEQIVKGLIEQFGGANPRHYTIADTDAIAEEPCCIMSGRGSHCDCEPCRACKLV